MRAAPVLITILLILTGCSQDATDTSPEWLHVLSRKKAAVASNATTTQKQVYADTLAAFATTHPTHMRAQAVYRHIQLDFAQELVSIGRYNDAIRFYQSVLRAEPANQRAISGLAGAESHLVVSRSRLLALEKGMSQKDVTQILGSPMPGWTERRTRRDVVLESWYYRKTNGGVAGVYFRNGQLFAAEENSQASLAPMTLQ